MWKKAKSVMRAITIWKKIQDDIYLYGTHNYEFRQTFKVTQSRSILSRAMTLGKDGVDSVSGRRKSEILSKKETMR